MQISSWPCCLGLKFASTKSIGFSKIALFEERKKHLLKVVDFIMAHAIVLTEYDGLFGWICLMNWKRQRSMTCRNKPVDIYP